MADTGIRGFYLVMDNIKSTLLDNQDVNTVTTGDITEVDLDKQTIFPLSHIILNNVLGQENTLSFNISILAMDIVDENKDATTDKFTGNNNEQDILNTQLAVINNLLQKLRFGTLQRNGYEIVGDANIEPFYERFENRLAGWAATFDVMIANDIEIC